MASRLFLRALFLVYLLLWLDGAQCAANVAAVQRIRAALGTTPSSQKGQQSRALTSSSTKGGSQKSAPLSGSTKSSSSGIKKDGLPGKDSGEKVFPDDATFIKMQQTGIQSTLECMEPNSKLEEDDFGNKCERVRALVKEYSPIIKLTESGSKSSGVDSTSPATTKASSLLQLTDREENEAEQWQLVLLVILFLFAAFMLGGLGGYRRGYHLGHGAGVLHGRQIANDANWITVYVWEVVELPDFNGVPGVYRLPDNNGAGCRFVGATGNLQQRITRYTYRYDGSYEFNLCTRTPLRPMEQIDIHIARDMYEARSVEAHEQSKPGNVGSK